MKRNKKREPAAARSGGVRALIARHSSVRGAYSLGLMAAAVAVVIVFNLIIGQIPSAKMQLDMTGSQIYNITDTSLEYLAELFARHGYSDDLIDRIFYQNSFRFFEKYMCDMVKSADSFDKLGKL